MYSRCMLYLFSTKRGFLEECVKEENVEVTVSSLTSCLNRSLQDVLSNVTYLLSHRQAGAFMINIQSTLRAAPDLCESFHTQCYLVATVIHMQSVRSQMRVYMHTLFAV